MKNSDMLRKSIETSNTTRLFAEALLIGDYFTNYIMGPNGSTTHAGIVVSNAVEKAGVRQDITADEKESLSAVINHAFIEGSTYGANWKNKVPGTKAKAAKFFDSLVESMKDNEDFAAIVISYLDDESMEQVKLVVDDNNTLIKIAMWIVVRSIMIPITPMHADVKTKKADNVKVEATPNVSVDNEIGKVVIDGEYVELESTAIKEENASKMNEDEVKPENKTAATSAPTNHDKDIVDERNDAISNVYNGLKSLGIPDEKIYDVLGIKVSNVEGGASVKASTSYKDTSEKNDSSDKTDDDDDRLDLEQIIAEARKGKSNNSAPLRQFVAEQQDEFMHDDIDDENKGLFARESNRLMRVLDICANFGKTTSTELVKVD